MSDSQAASTGPDAEAASAGPDWPAKPTAVSRPSPEARGTPSASNSRAKTSGLGSDAGPGPVQGLQHIVCVGGIRPAAYRGRGQRDARYKSPMLAGFLSVMPGLGQVYVGYYQVGFVHAIITFSIIGVTVVRRRGTAG